MGFWAWGLDTCKNYCNVHRVLLWALCSFQESGSFCGLCVRFKRVMFELGLPAPKP